MNEKNDRNAIKAGTWYTIGNFFLKGCLFLTIPIFTRILTPFDFGIYNTYIAYEGILSSILGLGLYGTIKTAKFDFKEKFNDYISSILSLSIIIFCLVVLIANVFYGLYSNFVGFSKCIVNILLFQSFGSYLIFMYGTKLSIEFKYKPYLLISICNIIGNIIISIILIKFVFPNLGYIGRILGSALPLILISIVLIIVIFKNSKCFFSKKYWKYALIIGLPLIPHVVSQSLLSQFDRIMINNIIGAEEAGIYSYIYTLCTVTYIICTSLDNAWTPWTYIRLSNHDYSSIKQASKKYLILFALLSVGFICVMPEITMLFASKLYWDGISLLIPVTIANSMIFLYMLPVNVEYYNKKTFFISIGTVLTAIINIVLNYIFIPKFGYKAAAYTTLISYFALFLLHLIIAKRYDFFKIYDKNYIIKYLIIIFAFSSIIFFSNCYLNYFIYLVIRYVIILVIIIYLIKFFKIFDFIKKRRNEK